jgi:formate dehydrogenase subunit gamma
MYYPDLVRLSWRTGASFVHDWFALAIGLLVAGHISYAMRDAESRRGMRTGRVSTVWARDHHGAWADEAAGAQATPTTAGTAPRRGVAGG